MTATALWGGELRVTGRNTTTQSTTTCPLPMWGALVVNGTIRSGVSVSHARSLAALTEYRLASGEVALEPLAYTITTTTTNSTTQSVTTTTTTKYIQKYSLTTEMDSGAKAVLDENTPVLVCDVLATQIYLPRSGDDGAPAERSNCGSYTTVAAALAACNNRTQCRGFTVNADNTPACLLSGTTAHSSSDGVVRLIENRFY